jgi:hypothetical protein
VAQQNGSATGGGVGWWDGQHLPYSLMRLDPPSCSIVLRASLLTHCPLLYSTLPPSHSALLRFVQGVFPCGGRGTFCVGRSMWGRGAFCSVAGGGSILCGGVPCGRRMDPRCMTPRSRRPGASSPVFNGVLLT